MRRVMMRRGKASSIPGGGGTPAGRLLQLLTPLQHILSENYVFRKQISFQGTFVVECEGIWATGVSSVV